MTSTAVRHSGPAARPAPVAGSAMWAPSADATAQVAFRTTLHVDRPTAVTIHIQAAGEFRLWVDGATIATGPLRYARPRPEVHSSRSMLTTGDHALAIQATGCPDLTGAGAAFVWVAVQAGTQPLDLTWYVRRLRYREEGRISPRLSYLEWQERPISRSWLVDPPGPNWHEPQILDEVAARFAAIPEPASAWKLPSWPLIAPTEIGRGLYRDTLTGPGQDPLTQFLLADTCPGSGDDVDGLWIRYDLGRTRIGTLEFNAAASQPAEVTLAYADRLDARGSLVPIAPMATQSRLMQHFQLAAGSQRVEPIGAIGGRYLELRVRSRGAVTVNEAHYRDRDCLGEPVGQFECADSLLNRIWQVGLTTLRACAEDILVDAPTNRSEGLTALAGVGIDLLSVGWDDLRLARRALVHAAANARADGLVADGGPDQVHYRGSSAAQWLTACMRYASRCGDTSLLHELAPEAAANAAALLAGIAEDGSTALPDSFIDWGYPPPADGPDLALLCHVYRGLRSWVEWQHLIGIEVDPLWQHGFGNLHRIVSRALGETEPNYWSAALAVHAGLQGADAAAPLIADHLAQGFPFDPEAERLRDPSRTDPCAITPYFTTFTMPVLLAVGQTDAVFDLWRRGWGWMLAQDAHTWWEVFDDRWGRCHYWSAAPSWQLSRYVLGLRPRLAAEAPTLALAVHPGSLDSARGVIPVAGDQIQVSWLRRRNRLSYTIKTPRPLTLVGHRGAQQIEAGMHRLDLSTTNGWSFSP